MKSVAFRNRGSLPLSFQTECVSTCDMYEIYWINSCYAKGYSKREREGETVVYALCGFNDCMHRTKTYSTEYIHIAGTGQSYFSVRVQSYYFATSVSLNLLFPCHNITSSITICLCTQIKSTPTQTLSDKCLCVYFVWHFTLRIHNITFVLMLFYVWCVSVCARAKERESVGTRAWMCVVYFSFRSGMLVPVVRGVLTWNLKQFLRWVIIRKVILF